MQIELIDEEGFLDDKKWSDFRVDSRDFSSYLAYITEHSILNYGDKNLAKLNLFVEVILIDRGTMQNINKEFLQKDYPTDVLSFPLTILQEAQNIQCFGSIIINTDEAIKKAKENKHNIYAEMSILFIHAFLHLLGFDHECDNGEQRKAEKEVINFLKLNIGLIDRTLES